MGVGTPTDKQGEQGVGEQDHAYGSMIRPDPTGSNSREVLSSECGVHRRLVESAGIATLDHEVPTVAIQPRPIENVVVRFQVDVRAVRHGPVLVVAEEQVLPGLMEEPARDALAPRYPLAEGRKQLLLAVLLDDDVLVRPRVTR